jgi:hypothetical protein
MLQPIEGQRKLPSGPRHHHAAIIMLLHCCARAAPGFRSQASCYWRLASLLSRTARRRGKARLEGFPTQKLTCESCDTLVLSVHVLPRVPALTRSTSLLFPESLSQEERAPSHGVQDRTGSVPNPKDFPIPNGTRIHFSIILPDVRPSFHALHREIALPTDWNAKGGSIGFGWSRTPQSLTSVSRAGFLVERRLLLLAA